jgi:hypothetical protein
MISNWQLAIGNYLIPHWYPIVKASLHLPLAHIKPSLGAATETGSIGPALVGERPAELHMPATKYSRY